MLQNLRLIRLQNIDKKSARFVRTFSSHASRAARKIERARGARPSGRRASRSVMRAS